MNSDTLKQRLIKLLTDSSSPLSKREIIIELGIKGNDRREIKSLLADLQETGELIKGFKRRYELRQAQGSVGRTVVVIVTRVDEDGNLWAEPLLTEEEDGTHPKLYLLETSNEKRTISLGIGSHALIKVTEDKEDYFLGHVLKRLDRGPRERLGLFMRTRRGATLGPCHRKDKSLPFPVPPKEAQNLEEGEIVRYVTSPHFRILGKVGHIDDPKTFSLLAIYDYGIPFDFSDEALALAGEGKVPELGKRVDFRDIPLVTIDGEDARDFDDAVFARADSDPRNEGGWRILVAIADVAYYVRPNDVLDKEAFKRGNSVYFPDRVVPMLPEHLSNGLCSLKPNEDRACMAIDMVITQDGKIKSFRAKRGLMRSVARLTYNQVQNALNGVYDDMTSHLMEDVIKPLHGAYRSLKNAREQRGTVDLSSNERMVLFGSDGHVDKVILRPQLESHQLIEEMMIAANVCAAKTLKSLKWSCMYRIHDKPDPMRIDNLRQVVSPLKMSFAKTLKPTAHQFNDLLRQAKKTPYAQMVNDLVLRSQAQAQYSPNNIGHYGLSLAEYAHFTSPIRRYADLIVHRNLITALDLGEGSWDDSYDPEDVQQLEHIGEHISATERQAMVAERDVMDRFMTAFLAPQEGAIFPAAIVGINRSGLFISLVESGAQGFVPRGKFPPGHYYLEEDHHRWVSRQEGIVLQLGGPCHVKLIMADVIESRLLFQLEDTAEIHKGSSSKHHGKKKFKGEEAEKKKKSSRNRSKKPRR